MIGVKVGIEDIGDLGVVLVGDRQIAVDICCRIDDGHAVSAGADRVREAGLGHPVDLDNEVGPVIEEHSRDQGIGPQVHSAVEVLDVLSVHHLDNHARRPSVSTDGDDILIFRKGGGYAFDIPQGRPIRNVHGFESQFAFNAPAFELLSRAQIENVRGVLGVLDPASEVVGGNRAGHWSSLLRGLGNGLTCRSAHVSYEPGYRRAREISSLGSSPSAGRIGELRPIRSPTTSGSRSPTPAVGHSPASARPLPRATGRWLR